MAARAIKTKVNITDGPLLRGIIVFSLPIMLSGILQLLFNAADTVVVGQFAGTDSLAAVGSTGPLANLIVHLFFGLAVGANAIMARTIGAKNPEKAERLVHTSMLTAAIVGLFTAAIGVSMTRTFLVLMKTDPEVIDKAVLYLRLFCLGMPATSVYNFGAGLLRANGDTKRPLYILLIAGVLNVALNLLFVIGFKMDVAGVALATIISQYLSATLVVWCLVRERDYCRLRLKKLRFCKAELLEVLRMGVPAGLYGSIFSVANIAIQSAINSFGKVAMAGNAAGINIEGFVHTSMSAVASAAITFVGQCYGAKNYRRIKSVIFTSLAIVTVVGLVLGFIVLLFGRQIASLYTSDPSVMEAAYSRLRVVLPVYSLCGIMEVLVELLRGLGRSIMPTIVSFLGACVFRVIWVYTVFSQYETLFSLYLSFPISWLVTSLFHSATLMAMWRRLKKNIAPPPDTGEAECPLPPLAPSTLYNASVEDVEAEIDVTMAAETAATADAEPDVIFETEFGATDSLDEKEKT